MLRELHISNLATIAKVEIELAAGLNVFTGQTEAGKSLLLSALDLPLGICNEGDKPDRPNGPPYTAQTDPTHARRHTDQPCSCPLAVLPDYPMP